MQVVLRERGVQRTSWVKTDGLERYLHAAQGQCQENDFVVIAVVLSQQYLSRVDAHS